MFHYKKTLKRYKRNKQSTTGCPFCNIDELKTREHKETKYMFIVPNLTFYDLWEVRDVEDHLLVIPKRHVKTLQDLTKEERIDMMNIMAEYEAKNYNIYARGIDSTKRSVEHQHTHLIKTSPHEHRGSLYIRKPYVFIKF